MWRGNRHSTSTENRNSEGMMKDNYLVVKFYLLRFKVFWFSNPTSYSTGEPMVSIHFLPFISYTSPTFQSDLETFFQVWNNIFYVTADIFPCFGKAFLNCFLYWGSNILLYKLLYKVLESLLLYYFFMSVYFFSLSPFMHIQGTWGS